MNYREWDKGAANIDIVLAEIHKKPQTASMLGEILKIKRESIYYYLNKLYEYGFIEKKRIKKKMWYGITKENRK